jgi:hypothetical protein
MGFEKDSTSPSKPIPFKLIIVLEQIEHAVPVTIAAKKMSISSRPHFFVVAVPPDEVIVFVSTPLLYVTAFRRIPQPSKFNSEMSVGIDGND